MHAFVRVIDIDAVIPGVVFLLHYLLHNIVSYAQDCSHVECITVPSIGDYWNQFFFWLAKNSIASWLFMQILKRSLFHFKYCIEIFTLNTILLGFPFPEIQKPHYDTDSILDHPTMPQDDQMSTFSENVKFSPKLWST